MLVETNWGIGDIIAYAADPKKPDCNCSCNCECSSLARGAVASGGISGTSFGLNGWASGITP